MEARPRGSFGMPPEMVRQVAQSQKEMAEKAKAQAAPHMPKGVQLPQQEAMEPVVPQAESPAPQDDVKTTAPDSEAERQKQIKKLRAELEQSLGIEITHQDIKDYTFKGRLSKEIEIVPEVLKAVFQTLTPAEFMEIDTKTAELRDEKKYTQSGLDNQVAILNLSYAWTHANGRPLSPKNETDTRSKYIFKMGAHVVDVATVKLNEFNTLIRIVLQEKDFLKKPSANPT